jgi:cellulose synthase/poly-beta-1,6-N-acetylglucosamine synthase-like glycosyltransferase
MVMVPTRPRSVELVPAPTIRPLPVPAPGPRKLLHPITVVLTAVRDFFARWAERRRDRAPRTRLAKVVVIIPAHNEEDVIGACLESLLRQSRRPDKIVVAADNCDDGTALVAGGFKGVTVFHTVDNEDRKVGALTQAWRRYADGYDFVVGVDADTILAPDCLAQLEAEMVRNPGIGGLMARYTFDQGQGKGVLSRLLLRMQRFEFTGWTVDILRRRRRTYVLGGQATMFRAEALEQIVRDKKRLGPWDPSAQVEDMELTWSLNEAGWECKVSSAARAYVGPMLTLKSLWAQRRKWDEGMIRLLLQSGVNRTTLYPWRMQAKMALDFITRFLFAVLMTASLVTGNFRWYWIWVIPPALAILVNLRTLRRMPHRTAADALCAVTLLPIEAYLWLRLTVWITSWFTVLMGIRRDGWARQYRAEGKAGAKAVGSARPEPRALPKAA